MKTILNETHRALGAKMVEFAGWEMPILYKGIIHEHQAVRNNAGIFDVSHMGRIEIEGFEGETLMDYLSTNKILGREDGTATYTVWCHEDGGCVDDLIVYRVNQNKFFVIVNAGNRQKDLEHLISHTPSFDVMVTSHYDDEGILAIQGPKAVALVKGLFPEAGNVEPMHFTTGSYKGKSLILSRTGYTGADGFEIYAPLGLIKPLWDYFVGAGAEPIGLGARDTLRLEMGYALYGHELSDTISASESVSAWTIKPEGRDFLGKGHLEAIAPNRRRQCGIVLLDKGIAREGYTVLKEGREIGVVTSGTLSPTLNQSIAIILVDSALKIGDHVDVQIRQNICPAKIVKLPFLQK